jgi:putative hydroxymethylpyrimidine transport system permease protein
VRRLLRPVPALLLIAALIGAWEAYVESGAVDDLVLPAPHEIASALYTSRSILWSAFLVTAREILLGVAIAGVGGLVLAIAIHFSATLRRAMYPLLVASQAIPVPILAPPLAFWLGFGILPKLIVVAIVSFFSVVVTTLAGLDSVDVELLKLMRTFDATRRRTFWHVELPSALPGLFTGLRITVVVAVIGDVLAEQGGGSTNGLGYILLTANGQLLAAETYAAALILCLLAVALFVLLSAAERYALPWAYTRKGVTT